MDLSAMLLLLLLLAPAHASLRSFHYSVDFPRVPYHMGLRHIHTPEHVATTHRLGMPFYRVTNSTKPMQHGDVTCVEFSAGPCHRVCMFTQDPSRSYMVFSDAEGELRATVCMWVRPLDKGHSLGVLVTVYGCAWWTSLVVPLAWTLHTVEDRLWWSYSTTQDANLIAYRRKVLFREKKDTITSHLCSLAARPYR